MNSQQHHVYVDDQTLVYDQAACSSLTLAVIITQEKNPKDYSTPSSSNQIRKACSLRPMTKAERPAPKNIGNKTGLNHSTGRVDTIFELQLYL